MVLKDGSATIVPYDFRGDRLDVVRLPDGDVGVCLRRLSDALPVDHSSQVKRLARAAKRGAGWATVVILTTVAEDGKPRKMMVLPRRSIPMWAATVSLGKVREDLRPGATEKLARYQDQCAEALADRFLGQRQAAHGQDDRAPALPEPSPAPSLPQIRADLYKFIGSALEAGSANEVRTAMAALDVLLPDRRPSAKPSRSEGSPTRAPRPPAKTRRRAPRATAPKDPAFAARIQAILDLRGWSSNKLGEAAGIGSGPMSKLRRRGPAEAGGATLTKVADAAGVELRWLVTGEGPMTSSTLN